MCPLIIILLSLLLLLFLLRVFVPPDIDPKPEEKEYRIVFTIGPISDKKESIDAIRGTHEGNTHKYKKT